MPKSIEIPIEIPLLVTETTGIDRRNEPVTFGIPFPRGMLFENSRLVLLNEEGRQVPIQTDTLETWPDRSAKWVLLDFQGEILENTSKKYRLQCRECQEDIPDKGISLTNGDTFIRIDTGAAVFKIDKETFLPFASVEENEEALDIQNSRISLEDADGERYFPEIKNLTVETRGPLRVTLKVEGEFRTGRGRKFCDFFSRVSFFSHKALVQIDFTIKNPKAAKHPGNMWDLGDKNSVFFKDLCLSFSLKSKAEVKIAWKTQAQPRQPQFHLTGSNIIIYQDSSGGENWRSTNHVNRFGDVPHIIRGYVVSDDQKVLEQGIRANPLVFLGNSKIGISAAIKHFWENFPKALEVNKKSINIRLFPKYFNDVHELQGGEQKTHRIFLNFSNEPNALDWIQSPLIPIATPAWYADSKAIPYLTPYQKQHNDEYESLINEAVKGKNSFFCRREIIDEYGWRNFGDVYADHEAVGHTGSTPLISHYNNQYDLIYSALFQYLRTADASWYKLMNELAWHVRDIDLYHTDQDKDEYNGGLFWHTDHYIDAATSTHRAVSKEYLKVRDPKYVGGGPAMEHNYALGLFYHYLLTGEVASKEAVLELSDWTIREMEKPNTVLGALYGFKQKIPQWKRGFKEEKIFSARYPFTRGTGNSIVTLISAFKTSGDRCHIHKIEELIRGCIHPHDTIEARDLLNAERCWSYTVCLQAVGKYLDLKLELGEDDEMFCYAKDALLHYAKWMCDHEYPYLEKPEILEYPNESWPAQDMRKNNIFLYAAMYSRGDQRKRFLEKAHFFFTSSIQSINTFKTKILARPVVLLLQNGCMYFYFRENPGEAAKSQAQGNDGSGPGRQDYRDHQESLNMSAVCRSIVLDLVKAARKTSFKKEIRWVMNRIQ
jgi:hypothetical protein